MNVDLPDVSPMGPNLFSPFRVRNLKLTNRIVLSPMCQYSAVEGLPTAWHQAHYGARMIGGVGLLMLESTAVSASGRITHGCLGLWNAEQAQALGRLVATAHELSVPIGVQLNHAGRKGSVYAPWGGGKALQTCDDSWPVVAPSAMKQSEGFPMPREISRDEIAAVVDQFAAAALRAVQAGFDVVELHVAHGYLLHQFISPLSNWREDAYGGDFEGRVRIVLETVEAVRAVLPAGFPLFVRLSCNDGASEGWGVEEAVRLAVSMRERGVDLVDCTSGGIAAALPRKPGIAFNAEAAARVRAEGGIATGAVGGITGIDQAQAVVASAQADLLFLGRALLSDPFWALRARQMLNAGDVPVQYQRATF